MQLTTVPPAAAIAVAGCGDAQPATAQHFVIGMGHDDQRLHRVSVGGAAAAECPSRYRFWARLDGTAKSLRLSEWWSPG